MIIYDLLVTNALDSESREAYISDMSDSLVWYGNDAGKWHEAANADESIPPERMDLLGEIYDATQRSVKEIAARANMSQRKLAERFHIPYRTMENWCSKVNECPLYTRLMMQECLGFYDPALVLKEIKL
ncbi:hypothetical protein bpr_II185 (plasmid) [Butyrivibrio proteoclasticus B316]|uniref:Uncharacterized protein n=1 Tax=Butyrivibrio proteoclasticus (strain ATCC 51982 / DSM 14932 / B316) TaxID=515622 RepID=E0S3Z1_BUTPB|nr:hypothetical protein [Butyrivibrio proteoclasticus]ADL36123.1 hypothetical protein bpr_II185 [Butyrivibrio proteoclasticus B316]